MRTIKPGWKSEQLILLLTYVLIQLTMWSKELHSSLAQSINVTKPEVCLHCCKCTLILLKLQVYSNVYRTVYFPFGLLLKLEKKNSTKHTANSLELMIHPIFPALLHNLSFAAACAITGRKIEKNMYRMKNNILPSSTMNMHVWNSRNDIRNKRVSTNTIFMKSAQ